MDFRILAALAESSEVTLSDSWSEKLLCDLWNGFKQ